MSSVEHEFLRDIVEHPDSDVPRLIYADWLEERGSPRGEFIRVQCELAQLDAADPARGELESRELQLIRRHSKGWARSIRPYARKWSFHRGMIEGVELHPTTFLEHGEKLLKLAPLRHVKFREAVEYLEELASCQSVAPLSSISLRNSRIGRAGNPRRRFDYYRHEDEWDDNRYETLSAEHSSSMSAMQRASAKRLSKFLKSPLVRQSLRSLDLEDNTLGDVGVAALAKSPAAASLVWLNLRNNRMTPKGVESLARRFPKLRSLLLDCCENIHPNYEEDDWVGDLPRALAPMLSDLEELYVSRCGFTLDAMREVNVQPVHRLKRLSIAGSMITTQEWREDEGVPFSELVESPLLANLDYLDMSSCYLDEAHLAALLASERLVSLSTLNLDNNKLERQGAEALADSPNLVNLLHLSVNGRISTISHPNVDIGDDGAARILHARPGRESPSEPFPRLASLSLRNQSLGAASARALLASPYLEQLYRVDLRHNQLGAEGAAALADHGPWPNLAVLNLRQNKLTSPDKDALAESFGFRVVF